MHQKQTIKIDKRIENLNRHTANEETVLVMKKTILAVKKLPTKKSTDCWPH